MRADELLRQFVPVIGLDVLERFLGQLGRVLRALLDLLAQILGDCLDVDIIAVGVAVHHFVARCARRGVGGSSRLSAPTAVRSIRIVGS
jgi:hypothetical protein